jgi:hypothetical protein
VREEGDKGASEELLYVDEAQGLDQGPEEPKANLANEGKPRIINPCLLKIMQLFHAMLVHLRFWSCLKP